MSTLGTLEPVSIREVWQGEATDFTPWLARPENLERLAETLAMSLEPTGTETRVGSFFADIVCTNLQDDSTVLIENQLERTDHRHLGQIFTYAAGLDAVTIVWVSPQFSEEHRAAIDWLNRITLDGFSFFAVEIELWRIGDSPPAPHFNVVAKPNHWSKAMRRKRPDSGTGAESSELGLAQMAFWEGFKDYLASVESPIHCQNPGIRRGMWHAVGRSGLALCSVITSPNRAKGGSPEIRAVFVIHDDPDGSRLEKLRHLEKDLAEATGSSVHFEPSADTASRSKLAIYGNADWTDEQGAREAYKWLDAKHRAILDVIKPHLASI